MSSTSRPGGNLVDGLPPASSRIQKSIANQQNSDSPYIKASREVLKCEKANKTCWSTKPGDFHDEPS